LTDAARRLEAAGADLLLICTNTMHKVAPAVEAATAMPLLHIADATARRLQADGIRRVGLLGTRFTMEQDFYKGRLEQDFGLEVLVPEAAAREQVHRIIYQELCLGETRAASRAQYLDIIGQLKQCGAEAVILGCTEITLLIQQSHTSLPLYDTTAIHAQAAVTAALAG
nr:amino acid racemase [Thiolinea sp.]